MAALPHACIAGHKRKIHHLFYYRAEHIRKTYKYYTMKVMAIEAKQYTRIQRRSLPCRAKFILS